MEYNLEYVAVPVQDRTCMYMRAGGVTEQYKIWPSPRICIHIFRVFGGVSQGGLCVCGSGGWELCGPGVYCVLAMLYCVSRQVLLLF